MARQKTDFNERGKAIYDKALGDLTERGLYAPVDDELLRAYALEMQTYYRMFSEVAKEGEAVDTGTGSVKSNPKLLRMESALKNAKQLASLLGISADARKKVGAAGKKQATTSKLRSLMNKKQAK